jgi:hypothetical protein
MDAVTSCHLATSLRRTVGSLDTVAARLPRVVEPLRSVTAYYMRAAGPRCAGAVLQSACPHVLLAFNAPPAACLAGAWRHPCHVAPWKIHTRLNGDHDGHIARRYLFTLMAQSL